MNEAPLEPRERLLQAAIHEFALHGYDQGTVRRICSRAEVNLNAVKYYFADKRGLYVEAVKQAHRARVRLFQPPGPSLEGEVAGDPPIRALQTRLRAFIHQMVSMSLSAEEQADYNQLLIFREIAEPSEATQHIVREFIRPHFDLLNEILKELLPEDHPVIDRRLLAFSVVGQCMHYKVAAPIIPMLLSPEEMKKLDVDRVADHIFRVVCAAIGTFRKPA